MCNDYKSHLTKIKLWIVAFSIFCSDCSLSHFIVVSALGRLSTHYNVQQVLEMEWHDLYCMLLVNHSLYLMLCLQSSEVSILFLVSVTAHLASMSSVFIMSPIYVFDQFLMLLSITQVKNVHLMLLLLCRERQGSLVS